MTVIRGAAFVAMVAAVVGCATPRWRPYEVASPRARLQTIQRVAMAPHAQFRFRLWVDPPATCPLVSWDFGDGSRCSRASDCEPGERGPRLYERWHTYREAGDYVVLAVVSEGGLELARASMTVIVQAGLGGSA